MSGDLKITAFHLYFERFPALVLRRVAVGARGARAVSQGKAQDSPFLYGPTWLLLRPQRHGMRRPVLCSMLGGAYRVVKPRAPTSAATSGLRADRRFRLGARFFIPKMHQRRAPHNGSATSASKNQSLCRGLLPQQRETDNGRLAARANPNRGNSAAH